MKDSDNSFRKNLFLGALLIIIYFLLSNIKDLYLSFGSFLSLLNPFIIGFAIAYVLNLPMTFIENKILSFPNTDKLSNNKFKRPISIILTFVLVIGFLIMVILFIVPELLSNLTALLNTVQSYLSGPNNNLSSYLEALPISPEIINDLSTSILKAWKEWLTLGGQLISSSLTGIISTTISITTGLVDFVLSIIFAIYMLASKETLILGLKKLMKAFLPSKLSKRLLYLGKISNITFSKFIAGQCTESLILGLLCFIGMSILKIPYALVVSVLVGITALIPVFGAFIGIVPSVLLILLIDPTKALWFIIFILCLQQIEGNVIYPKVVGNSVGLSPLLVMLAILVGGKTLGLLGMLIGIPIFSIAYQIIRNKTNKRLKYVNSGNTVNKKDYMSLYDSIENHFENSRTEKSIEKEKPVTKPVTKPSTKTYVNKKKK